MELEYGLCNQIDLSYGVSTPTPVPRFMYPILNPAYTGAESATVRFANE
jgi:hypothetical protein